MDKFSLDEMFQIMKEASWNGPNQAYASGDDFEGILRHINDLVLGGIFSMRNYYSGSVLGITIEISKLVSYVPFVKPRYKISTEHNGNSLGEYINKNDQRITAFYEYLESKYKQKKQHETAQSICLLRTLLNKR